MTSSLYKSRVAVLVIITLSINDVKTANKESDEEGIEIPRISQISDSVPQGTASTIVRDFLTANKNFT